ncbi:PHB depolymerase family esterase [Novosphingobium sediminicola]|uniref:Putative peptidase n=1 Tax=Novosphingobium sediminicola TaxID=563162 RepID=A0A7W6CDG6_9SPHN|nr:PHB depolymerase family esterase [Novosphingobium sediminicola]MBB3953807.1 putative peptidase [Novosphingobium sediminicola]
MNHSFHRRALIQGGLALLLSHRAARAAGGAYPRATAVTRVFGEGPKFVAIALDYGVPVLGGKLGAEAFAVEGRKIARAYTSDSPTGSPRPSGRFVILELSAQDKDAMLRVNAPAGPNPGAPAGGPPMNGPPRMPAFTVRRPQASIRQVAPVRLANGRVVAPSPAPVGIGAVITPIVDDFRQMEWRDPANSLLIRYNLFVPKGYSPKKRYPLVLFMHDASVTTTLTQATLVQGLGALCWASPQDQAKRPCFVLAPQFERQVANDDSETTGEMDSTVALIGMLGRKYAIDPRRIYTTGQSGGAMMSIAMNIKYPDLFAASFIVAGQWAAEKCALLARQNMWIMVAQGDLKAFPGQNAITAEIERHGAKISRATWDGRWDAPQWRDHVAAITAQGNRVIYTVLAQGTVVPEGQSDNGGSNHVNTWRIAYTIPEIRDWIMQWHK